MSTVNTTTKARKRRTADEAKALLLQTAADRLREHGMDGLTVKGVAEEAGMSHATLIHHFGSSDGMRRALEVHLTARLLADITSALKQDVPAESLCADLFETLSADGHTRLLAWLAVDDSLGQLDHTGGIQDMFGELIRSVASRLAHDDETTAKNLVMLIASTAIGLGITRDSMPNLIGMSDAERDRFPEWLVNTVIGDQA